MTRIKLGRNRKVSHGKDGLKSLTLSLNAQTLCEHLLLPDAVYFRSSVRWPCGALK